MPRRKNRHIQVPTHSAGPPARKTESPKQQHVSSGSQPTKQPPLTRRSGRVPWVALSLTGFVWVYVFIRIFPPLLYDHAWKPFYLETAFLTHAAAQPGGLLGYAAAFVGQLNQFAVPGAAVTTVIIGLLGATAAKVSQFKGPIATVPGIIPGLSILVMEGRYAREVYDVSMGVLLAGTAYLVWKRFARLPGKLPTALFLAIWVLVYWVAGKIPTLVFVLTASITTTRLNRSVLKILPYWLVTAAIFGTCAISFQQLTREFVGSKPDTIALLAKGLLCLCLPITAGLATSMVELSGASEPRHPSGVAFHNMRIESPKGKPGHRRDGLVLAATLVVAIVILLATFDRRTRLLGSIQLNALAHKWNSVLALAQHLKTEPTPAVRLAIVRALYHTGKLHKDLFAYPQRKGVEILPSLREGVEVCDLLADTMIELGQVNLAEHFAHESLELRGERPSTLWQLGRIYVLKDRPKAASVFLKRLSLVPFHRNRALKRLSTMEIDPALSSEPDISRVRPLRVTSDIADSGLPTEVVVRQCLNSNKHNRMAFEFMLAHYLLETQLDLLVENAEFLGDYGIWETPRHIEEAILLHESIAGTSPTSPRPPHTNTAVAQRFELLRKTIRENGGKVDGIEQLLARDFGDTYWFYHFFGRTFGGHTGKSTRPK